MNRHLLIILAVLGLAGVLGVSACGKGPPCSCIAGEIKPACKEACEEDEGDDTDPNDNPENVGKSGSALTLGASAFYSISYAAGYGPDNATACNDPSSSQWCECNVVYSDTVKPDGVTPALRCNDPISTNIFEFPAPGCVVASATFTETVQESAVGRTVTLARILPTVTTPPLGQAGVCVSSSVASWWRSGAAPWQAPGANGAADRALGPSRVLTVTAAHVETFDVTELVQGCPATGACVLAQYSPDGHVAVHPGAQLVVTCGSPATCGDGVVEGAEGCDDGAAAAGDGCSAACALEPGWTCSGAPSVCSTTCGDGIAAGTEECDDGGNVSGDGCSAGCVAEVCSCE